MIVDNKVTYLAYIDMLTNGRFYFVELYQTFNVQKYILSDKKMSELKTHSQ